MPKDRKSEKTALEKFINIYMSIGAIMIGLLGFLVIFTVVMRYFFSLNWKQLAEFNVTLFAASTFWGMGCCILTDDHVIIDAFYDRCPIKMKRIMLQINYIIVFAVMGFFVKYSLDYVMKVGVQISLGMGIPMYYIYGIMPLTGILCMICVVVKMIVTWKKPDEFYARKNAKMHERGN